MCEMIGMILSMTNTLHSSANLSSGQPVRRFMGGFRDAMAGPLRGIGLYCLALILFVGMGTISKTLSATYPVEQVVWARYFFHVLLIMMLFPRRILGLFRTQKLGLQITRSVVVFCATAFGFTPVPLTPGAGPFRWRVAG